MEKYIDSKFEDIERAINDMAAWLIQYESLEDNDIVSLKDERKNSMNTAYDRLSDLICEKERITKGQDTIITTQKDYIGNTLTKSTSIVIGADEPGGPSLSSDWAPAHSAAC